MEANQRKSHILAGKATLVPHLSRDLHKSTSFLTHQPPGHINAPGLFGTLYVFFYLFCPEDCKLGHSSGFLSYKLLTGSCSLCQKSCEKGEWSGYIGKSFVGICVSLAMGPAHISVSLMTFMFQEILAYAKVLSKGLWEPTEYINIWNAQLDMTAPNTMLTCCLPCKLFYNRVLFMKYKNAL